jgi:hypothetical protein
MRRTCVLVVLVSGGTLRALAEASDRLSAGQARGKVAMTV